MAVIRTTPRPFRDVFVNGRYYSPYWFYNPYAFGFYGSFGPSFYGYYGNPYTLGYGYGLGFPYMWDPWADPMMDPYAGGGGAYSATQYRDGSEDQGNLRLKIKPRDAKVYIDGQLVGTVDDMDGTFQKMPLTGGKHHVEIKADGYQTEEFDAMITPHQTTNYQGQLKKIL